METMMQILGLEWTSANGIYISAVSQERGRKAFFKRKN